ncbi:hypothetical protein [Parabacteroides sp. PF5-6]|uniref:hypothetical protein n=1 Tax=Parabacteroides sp. PF5-6 TaxID=1742403 RepID=UPI0024060765|nr:hypothetical protein [Parabacteroides sp. PF5-6]MDF9829535.1 hypothetical protein [Parabacteroides sp. PF5-6]
MKPLILSFFAVILFYSLFIDKKEEKVINKPIPVDTRSTRINTVDTIENSDSIVFYANRYMYDFKL